LKANCSLFNYKAVWLPKLIENYIQFFIILNKTDARSNDVVKQNKDLKSLPVRQYLDATVVPVVLQALTEVAK
jgi:hypothetical protein